MGGCEILFNKREGIDEKTPQKREKMNVQKNTIWALVKKGAEEGLAVLKEGVSIFMAEASKTSRMLKKRVELTSVQNQVKKAFTRIGALAYELHSKGKKAIYGNGEVKGLIAEIKDKENRVREIAAEMETIRREERRKASQRTSESAELPPSMPLT